MFTHYAVYFTPAPAFAARGAAWLGWDIATGSKVTHPETAGLDLAAITEKPRRYGFHGTIKAPFRLAEGNDSAALRRAFHHVCGRLAPMTLPALELAQIGRFLAFVPAKESADLTELARRAVEYLDPVRAPLTDDDIARRNPDRLTGRQRENLHRWGYPHVGADFKFHMTLTRNLKPALTQPALDHARRHFAKDDGTPLAIDALSLVGEAEDGLFHLIERRALGG